MAKELEEGLAEIVLSDGCQVPARGKDGERIVQPAAAGSGHIMALEDALDIVGANRGVFVRGGPGDSNNPERAAALQEAAAAAAEASAAEAEKKPRGGKEQGI